MLRKKIKNINLRKATTKNNISPRLLKESHKDPFKFLQKLISGDIISGKFQKNLKLADVTPVFKKKIPQDKTSHRPVSVLLKISKIFEKLMEKQLNYSKPFILSPYLCGYRKC